ncbi:DUF402 domain-containing protein [Tengunoibacter tsumagoiensis]|uniref:DUF402 domain-containing protein n=1 Tax=Tengunoibacter tsumagoiensis TaxID=2014871 RepID=A0A401ZXT2_9CHLR|nr:DUF402 domain-containing protein [Tengunoibacter tsumagoiensis]GCE11647.1 hypothetical protein KTT_15060 [Tengunoibacter tsumagoiensis]
MITVSKLTLDGAVKVRYTGEICQQKATERVIRAYWTQPTLDLGYTSFEPNDCFIEYYYTERWFNVFTICSANGQLKGWYCNITEPAIFSDTGIQQVDLFLDLWVAPDGHYLLLDEDEFAAASPMLSQRQQLGAQQGLNELLRLIEQHEEMFCTLDA